MLIFSSNLNNHSEEFWGPKRKAGRLMKESADVDGQTEVKTKSKRGKNKNNRRKGAHNGDGKEVDDEGNDDGEDNRGVGGGTAMEFETSVGTRTGTVDVIATETGNDSSILGTSLSSSPSPSSKKSRIILSPW